MKVIKLLLHLPAQQITVKAYVKPHGIKNNKYQNYYSSKIEHKYVAFSTVYNIVSFKNLSRTQILNSFNIITLVTGHITQVKGHITQVTGLITLVKGHITLVTGHITLL